MIAELFSSNEANNAPTPTFLYHMNQDSTKDSDTTRVYHRVVNKNMMNMTMLPKKFLLVLCVILVPALCIIVIQATESVKSRTDFDHR